MTEYFAVIGTRSTVRGDQLLCGHVPDPFPWCGIGSGHTRLALDDVACTTAQSRLIDCTYDGNTADCSHTDDAGVACVARECHMYFFVSV